VNLEQAQILILEGKNNKNKKLFNFSSNYFIYKKFFSSEQTHNSSTSNRQFNRRELNEQEELGIFEIE